MRKRENFWQHLKHQIKEPETESHNFQIDSTTDTIIIQTCKIGNTTTNTTENHRTSHIYIYKRLLTTKVRTKKKKKRQHKPPGPRPPSQIKENQNKAKTSRLANLLRSWNISIMPSNSAYSTTQTTNSANTASSTT